MLRTNYCEINLNAIRSNVQVMREAAAKELGLIGDGADTAGPGK